EGRPGLAARARRARSTEVLLDRALADADPQLQQLALDALSAPEVILAGHPPDERDGLRRGILAVYAAAGASENWRLLRNETVHVETAAGRAEVLGCLGALPGLR